MCTKQWHFRAIHELWDAATGALIRTFPPGGRVLSGSWDNTLKDEGSALLKLNYTVADATAFAEEMNKAGKGFYGRVQVR